MLTLELILTGIISFFAGILITVLLIIVGSGFGELHVDTRKSEGDLYNLDLYDEIEDLPRKRFVIFRVIKNSQK